MLLKTVRRSEKLITSFSYLSALKLHETRNQKIGQEIVGY